MKKLSTLLILPILLLGSLLVTPGIFPVHAITGKVCLSSSSSCPFSAPLLPVVAVNGTLTVFVDVQGSDPLNGFDVQILTDNTVLTPTGVDTTGTILASGASPVLECINGVLAIGNACTLQDAIGVLHFAAVSASGGTTSGTSASGLLFKAVYTVDVATSLTSLSFNTGCTGTSQTNICVTVSNGNPASPVDFETTQGASFQNTQDFTLVASPSSLETPPGVPTSFTATVTKLGGLTGTVTLIANGGGLTISPSTAQTTSPVTYTVSSMTSASYTATITGTFSGLVLGKFTTITHQAQVMVTVAPTGFSLSANPSSESIPVGGSQFDTITVTSISGYHNAVTLSGHSPTAGVTASFNPSTVTPPVNDQVTSIATISVASTVATGSTDINITGTDGTTTNFVDIPLTIVSGDFNISLSPGVINVNRGLKGNVQVIVQSIGSFSGTISFGATPTQPDNSTDPTLPCVASASCTVGINNDGTIGLRGGIDSPGNTLIANAFTPSSIFLPAGGSANVTFTLFTASTDATGVFNTTLTGSVGTNSHSATLVFSIMDYAVRRLTPSTVTIAQGGPSFISRARVSSLGGPGGFGFFNFVGVIYPADIPTRGVFVPQLNSTAPPLGFYCFVDIFDSLGNHLSAATIASQGPVVFPGRFALHQSGCGSSGARYLPGPDDVQGPGNSRATSIAFANTPVGTYTVVVHTAAGNLAHSWSFTLVVVHPLAITFSHWFRNVHLFGSNKGETWNINVTSPAGNPTLNLKIAVAGIDSSGTITFADSVTLTIMGGQTVSVVLTQDFTSLVGTSALTTFTFATTISYGVTKLTTTTSNAVPGIPATSGTITVRA